MSIAKLRIKTGIVLIAATALLASGCAKDPQTAKAKYIATGQKYMKEKQYGDAAVEFRNAIRLDPGSADAYYQVAYMLSAKGEFFATGANIREKDGNLNQARKGEVVFWQTVRPRLKPKE